MASIEHLPAELLLKIWRMLPYFEDSNRMENPIINWHSKDTLFFQHDLAPKADLITTKVSIVFVCRRWHTLAAPWAYEHISVDSAARLKALASALDLADSCSARLAPLVKRLDIEVVDLGVIDLNSCYEDVVQVLRALPNLVTLTMMMPPYALAYHLMPSIPASLRHLFWSSPVLQVKAKVHAAHLLKFLETHARLETISFPFLFCETSVNAVAKSGYRKPHPASREWVLRHTNHSTIYTMLARATILPNVTSRAVTWPMHGFSTSSLLGGTAVCGKTQNPKITKLSLAAHLSEPMWLPDQLASAFRTINGLCPSLREFHLTYASNVEGVYNVPMRSSLTHIHSISQVKTLCIQRVFRGSELSDPIGTLHNVINVPWRTVFPNLRTIRIRENLELKEAMEHPTMAFVKEEGWGIQIEDRFGRRYHST